MRHLAAVVIILLSGVVGQAKVVTASPQGLVTDSSGAVVADANLTATNFQTGVQRSTTTNGDGFYRFNPFPRGGNFNDNIVGGPVGLEPEDAIEEFQVITNRSSAEYGHSSGPFINVVTKSGTNTLHRSGFVLYRQKDLQANGSWKRRNLILIASNSEERWTEP